MPPTDQTAAATHTGVEVWHPLICRCAERDCIRREASCGIIVVAQQVKREGVRVVSARTAA